MTHSFSVFFRSGELAGHSSAVMIWLANHLAAVLALWAGAKLSLSADGSRKCSPGWCCIDFGLTKNRTNHLAPTAADDMASRIIMESSCWTSNTLDFMPPYSSPRLQNPPQSSQGCIHSCCLCNFDTALCEQPVFWAKTLCFEGCQQRSAVFPMIVVTLL